MLKTRHKDFILLNQIPKESLESNYITQIGDYFFTSKINESDSFSFRYSIQMNYAYQFEWKPGMRFKLDIVF